MKKIISLMIALVLLTACAVAESSPSQSATLPVCIEGSLCMEDGSACGDGFRIYLTPIEDDTAEKDVFDSIAAGEVELLTVEYDIDEIEALNVEGYKDEYGNVYATFTFPVQYSQDDSLAAVVGVIIDEDDVDWFELEAIADENGDVRVLFPQTLLQAVNNHIRPAVFTLLKTK